MSGKRSRPEVKRGRKKAQTSPVKKKRYIISDARLGDARNSFECGDHMKDRLDQKGSEGGRESSSLWIGPRDSVQLRGAGKKTVD